MRKVKLLSAAILASAFTASAMAGGIPTMASGWSIKNQGPYLGVGAGINSARFRVQDAGDRVDFGDFGFNGTGFVGWNVLFHNHVNLAAEVTGDINNINADLRDSDEDDSIRIRLKSGWGAAFLPGYEVNNGTVLFGRVGWFRSKFEWEDKGGSDAAKHSTNLNALELGMGMQTDMSALIVDGLKFRLDYKYKHYSNKRFTGVSDLKERQNSNQANFSVIYQFDLV